MPSKESIAVILAAMALGLRKKGAKNNSRSKDIEPLIEEVTYDTFHPFDFIDSNFSDQDKENIFFHGSNSIEDVTNPVIKRNPKHPDIFSDQQKLQTPDQGVYVTSNLEYALEYAGLEEVVDHEKLKVMYTPIPGSEGKKDYYISIIQAEPDRLFIDEDLLGSLTISIIFYGSKIGLEDSYYSSLFEEPKLLSLDKQLDNPQSPLNILLNVYERALKKYGNDRPTDFPYSLNDMDRFLSSHIVGYSDNESKNKAFIDDSFSFRTRVWDFNIKFYIPRLAIFLGKRMNKVMTKEENRLLKRYLKSNKIILNQEKMDSVHSRMMLSPIRQIGFLQENSYDANIPLFISDPENKGIKPIKIYKILV